jgi:hypothetical protein
MQVPPLAERQVLDCDVAVEIGRASCRERVSKQV